MFIHTTFCLLCHLAFFSLYTWQPFPAYWSGFSPFHGSKLLSLCFPSIWGYFTNFICLLCCLFFFSLNQKYQSRGLNSQLLEIMDIKCWLNVFGSLAVISIPRSSKSQKSHTLGQWKKMTSDRKIWKAGWKQCNPWVE